MKDEWIKLEPAEEMRSYLFPDRDVHFHNVTHIMKREGSHRIRAEMVEDDEPRIVIVPDGYDMIIIKSSEFTV